MTAQRRETAVDDRPREMILSRVVDAPRELVWKVWTDPRHIIQWWGPTGFRTTSRSMDPVAGGQWRFVMHGPDGRDYENLITYLEVIKPERLSYKHGGGGDCEPVNFEVLVLFERVGDSGSQTRVTLRMVFPTEGAKDFVIRQYNALEGGKQTLARLEGYVDGLVAGRDADAPFVITRVVKAPPRRVFDLWTQRDHLARWFGPKGVTISECALDLKPGGLFRYCMRSADGSELWAKWTFREISDGERLVFVMSFSDQQGKTVRAPFHGAWPLEMLTTVTFEQHAGISGGTVVAVTSEAINASPAERRTLLDGHASMNEGWGGTFDVLDGYVSGL